MRYLLLLLLLSPGVLPAQSYSEFDTITDHQKAVRLLQNAVAGNASNPELYNRIAQRKIFLSEYDSSIFYCNRSIGLLTKSGNKRLLIRALHMKGIAQYYLDDKAKAETNWREALPMAMQENDYERIVKIASNLGAIYLDDVYLKRNNISNYQIADSFFSIAYRELRAKDSLASDQGLRTLRLMATSMHFQKKYDSAGYYYEKIITLSKNINPDTYIGALSFYAEMLSETGRHEKALAAIKEAAEFTAKNNLPSKDKTHIMHVYGNVLFKKGDFAEAYTYIDSSYRLLASDYEKMNTASYSESESKFRNQILRYQVELERQRKNRLYYLIGGTILLTPLVVVWLQSRNKKQIAQEKMRQKQVSIDAFIEGEEKEKARIGRELHDGIAQEIVGVKLAMQQQQADPKLVAELTRISLDIRNLSHELMPQTLREYGLKLAIEDICQKILAPSGIRYEVHSALPDERMPDKIEITLYRIFQELVHNIIKHSHATEVLVQLRKMSNHVLLMVEDNGKGMTDEKKNGIGISNLRSRVQLLDGNLQYDSSENEGTTAIVRVPV